jgi:hypothetical protein
MRNSLLAGERNFPSANVEAAIDLRRIAYDDFAAEFLCEINSEGGFTGGRGAEHNN